MAYTGQHCGALFDLPLNTVAHFNKMRRRHNALRSHRRGLKSGVSRPLPNSSAASAKALNRADLIAQENPRHHQQNDRCADHPNHEDMGVGGVNALSLGQHTHHLAGQQHANINVIIVSLRINPEGATRLAGSIRATKIDAASATIGVSH